MNTVSTAAMLGQGILFAIVGILFIWLVKIIDDWRTKDFNDDEHIDDGNMAVGLRRAGLYLGVAIALSGALTGTSNGFLSDLFILVFDGLIITGFMFSTRYLNDLMMLGNLNNDAECIRVFERPDGSKSTGNTAVGIVEAGMYIATGFILHGAVSGTGGTFIQGLGSAILFFVLGQMALLLFGFIYEMITPFNVRNEIKENNPAAGIGLAGMLIALGIILMGSISGPFTGWLNDLKGFCIYLGSGMILLLIFRMIAAKLLLPATNIATEVKEDKNSAALLVVESVINALAIIIAFSM